MRKKFVFYDENTGNTWWFDIISSTGDWFDKLSEEEMDGLVDDLLEDSHSLPHDICQNGDVESYGVHDVAFGEGEILGFSSYEISEDNFPEVMNIWRNIFYQRGILTSAIYKTHEDEL